MLDIEQIRSVNRAENYIVSITAYFPDETEWGSDWKKRRKR